jgi:hypothetical protein
MACSFRLGGNREPAGLYLGRADRAGFASTLFISHFIARRAASSSVSGSPKIFDMFGGN